MTAYHMKPRLPGVENLMNFHIWLEMLMIIPLWGKWRKDLLMGNPITTCVLDVLAVFIAMAVCWDGKLAVL